MQDGSMQGMGAGSVYVQTNEPDNHVIRFARADDGALVEAGRHATGGKGDGVAHLTSQGSVVLTRDARYVLVTNAASDDVSIFPVNKDGLGSAQMMATGLAPKSITEHDGVVYILNTGAPSVTGFRIADGRLVSIAGSERTLAMNADPAQVGFSRDGGTLVVTERGTDSITSFAVDADGLLGEPQSRPSSGPTPYGFAFTSNGALIVHRGVPGGEGRSGSVVVLGPRWFGDAGHRLRRQRSQRDLLGRRDGR